MTDELRARAEERFPPLTNEQLRERARKWLVVCREDYEQDSDHEFVAVIDLFLSLLQPKAEPSGEREEVEAVAQISIGVTDPEYWTGGGEPKFKRLPGLAKVNLAMGTHPLYISPQGERDHEAMAEALYKKLAALPDYEGNAGSFLPACVCCDLVGVTRFKRTLTSILRNILTGDEGECYTVHCDIVDELEASDE